MASRSWSGRIRAGRQGRCSPTRSAGCPTPRSAARFLAPKPRFSADELRYLTELDFCDHYAVVATPRERPGVLVGVGRWVRDERRSATRRGRDRRRRPPPGPGPRHAARPRARRRREVARRAALHRDDALRQRRRAPPVRDDLRAARRAPRRRDGRARGPSSPPGRAPRRRRGYGPPVGALQTHAATARARPRSSASTRSSRRSRHSRPRRARSRRPSGAGRSTP